MPGYIASSQRRMFLTHEHCLWRTTQPDETFLEYRRTILSNKPARQIFVQVNTFIQGEDVIVKEYEATCAGIIQSLGWTNDLASAWLPLIDFCRIPFITARNHLVHISTADKPKFTEALFPIIFFKPSVVKCSFRLINSTIDLNNSKSARFVLLKLKVPSCYISNGSTCHDT